MIGFLLPLCQSWITISHNSKQCNSKIVVVIDFHFLHSHVGWLVFFSFVVFGIRYSDSSKLMFSRRNWFRGIFLVCTHNMPIQFCKQLVTISFLKYFFFSYSFFSSYKVVCFVRMYCIPLTVLRVLSQPDFFIGFVEWKKAQAKKNAECACTTRKKQFIRIWLKNQYKQTDFDGVDDSNDYYKAFAVSYSPLLHENNAEKIDLFR